MCHHRPSKLSLHLTRWNKGWHIDRASACPCLSPSLPPLPPPDACVCLVGSILSILREISRSKNWSCKLVTSCLKARSSEVLTRIFFFLQKLSCSPGVSHRVELQVRGGPVKWDLSRQSHSMWVNADKWSPSAWRFWSMKWHEWMFASHRRIALTRLSSVLIKTLWLNGIVAHFSIERWFSQKLLACLN